MTELHPIDSVFTPKKASFRFDTIAFATNPLGSTLATILTGNPIVVNLVPPNTPPLVFHLPALPKEADFFTVAIDSLSLDAIQNTALGIQTWIPNDLKSILFNPGLGASKIEYDGFETEEGFLIAHNKLLEIKILKRSELRKIVFSSFAVSIAHNMANYQSTTAFVPDIVNPVNYIFCGIQLKVEAFF